MKKLITRLVRDENGVSAIEYGLMAVLIALVMAGGAVVLGEGLNKMFGDTGTAIKDAPGANPIPTPSPTYK